VVRDPGEPPPATTVDPLDELALAEAVADPLGERTVTLRWLQSRRASRSLRAWSLSLRISASGPACAVPRSGPAVTVADVLCANALVAKAQLRTNAAEMRVIMPRRKRRVFGAAPFPY